MEQSPLPNVPRTVREQERGFHSVKPLKCRAFRLQLQQGCWSQSLVVLGGLSWAAPAGFWVAPRGKSGAPEKNTMFLDICPDVEADF